MTIWTAIESDDLDALIEELGTADINDLNEEGAHAVHFAAAKDAIKCFKYLVDAKNITPYFAAGSYNGIGVEKLKKLKGDVTEGLYTKDGWTAMHIAAKEGSLNVMKYLVEELNARLTTVQRLHLLLSLPRWYKVKVSCLLYCQNQLHLLPHLKALSI